MVVQVAINGYGTIGKRVADAITLQDDMRVRGVTKTRPTFESWVAINTGYDLYIAGDEETAPFEKEGIPVKGTFSELVERSDIVVDATPETVGRRYKPLYERVGTRAIFQGGEKEDIAPVSFNAISNYEAAFGEQFVRVVSCNTTGLCRTIFPLHKEIGIEHVVAVLIRRAADPRESRKGPLNAVVPDFNLPSHHGPDVKCVLPEIDIETTAVKVPTTHMHVHSNIFTLTKKATPEEIFDIWDNYSRLMFVDAKYGIESTSQVMEMARELGRKRADLYENVIWRDGTHVIGRRLYFSQAIHQEAIVIPEIVDAIRSMCSIEKDKMKSIEKTNRSLRIGHGRMY